MEETSIGTGMPNSKETCDLIARVDERTLAIQDDLKNIRETMRDTTSSLNDHINSTERHLDGKFRDLETDFVKREEFDPIKKLVYGFAGFLLLSIGGMAMVAVQQSHPRDVPQVPQLVPDRTK